jgi:glutaconate CoA-transferase subunit A
VGSDLPKHNANIRSITCPFPGEKLAATPAINPDVTIIHAQRADRRGNVLIDGIVGIQKEAVLAARASIVTVEQVVDELHAPMNACFLPHWALAVCEVLRRPPELRARLLRSRQRLLPRLGRSRATAHLPRVDEAACSERRRTRSSHSAEVTAPAGRTPMADRVHRDHDHRGRRRLKNGTVCFVGIGMPSAAANLAPHPRARRSPVYESGTIGAKTRRCRCRSATASSPHADTVVSIPEIFRYWLQGGRVDVGFLGAAQVDRRQHRHHGNRD